VYSTGNQDKLKLWSFTVWKFMAEEQARQQSNFKTGF